MMVNDDKISLPDYLVKEKIRNFRIYGERQDNYTSYWTSDGTLVRKSVRKSVRKYASEWQNWLSDQVSE